MKKLALYIVLFLAIISSSCEDVIAVDLNTAPPKLVVTAAINWKKGTSGKQQKVILTTTTGFYNT